MPTYIDVHVLQTVPPSNVNRDQMGSPKTAYYGGVMRARVSSQAWKRAVRSVFRESLDVGDLGLRTLRVVELISERLERIAPKLSAEARTARATEAVEAAGLTVESKKAKKSKNDDADNVATAGKTQYLVFYSVHQLDRLADLAAAEGPVDKKAAKDAMKADHGIEVSLFGRMVAEDKDLNVDAAVQVAHALSTHAVEPESDYFTAVDDRNPVGESGAGMIGEVEFNSSTLYRYATVNLDGLVANLDSREVAARAAQAFVRGFVTSMPTGKQNTFANRTVPDAVVVSIRSDQPINMVGAFESAIPESTSGYVAASCNRLAGHFGQVTSRWGTPADHTWVIPFTPAADVLVQLGDQVTLDGLSEALQEFLGQRPSATT